MTAVEALDGRPVLVGAGLAGLLTALRLAPEPVVVLASAPLGHGIASAWAQGGIAAAVGPDDAAALHLADTLRAGDGLCDPAAAARIVGEGARAIEGLAALGVAFDRGPDGTLRLGLEAAHSRRRIVHAGGDGTGAGIMRALVAAVRRTPSITVLEGIAARRLLLREGRIAGVIAAGKANVAFSLATDRVVLATGGIGGLFEATTNPPTSIGLGLALAARAGAVLSDLEFVQFHPTALDCGAHPLPLVSEALRGEGAVLVDETGRRFMEGVPGGELSSRDVVARRVSIHRASGHRTFLDTRAALPTGLAKRFPTIHAACRAAGIDPAKEPIPVRPAAHYHMGGIVVDEHGATTVPGLWACGEVAATGLHGANRLASNSLLEAAVTAEAVARAVAAAPPEPGPLLPPSGAVRAALPPPDADAVRAIASRALGVLRDEAGLTEAIDRLAPIAAGPSSAADPALVALMIAVSARRRRESRGAHMRTDYPRVHERPVRSLLTAAEALGEALAPARPIARSA